MRKKRLKYEIRFEPILPFEIEFEGGGKKRFHPGREYAWSQDWFGGDFLHDALRVVQITEGTLRPPRNPTHCKTCKSETVHPIGKFCLQCVEWRSRFSKGANKKRHWWADDRRKHDGYVGDLVGRVRYR